MVRTRDGGLRKLKVKTGDSDRDRVRVFGEAGGRGVERRGGLIDTMIFRNITLFLSFFTVIWLHNTTVKLSRESS